MTPAAQPGGSVLHGVRPVQRLRVGQPLHRQPQSAVDERALVGAEAAREQLRAAQARVVEVENAQAAEQQAAREALAAAAAEASALRAELAQARSDAHAEQSRLLNEARSDRETLRAQYAEQLAQLQRHADERTAALNQALELVRDTAQAYRAQLGAQRSEPDSPTQCDRRGQNATGPDLWWRREGRSGVELVVHGFDEPSRVVCPLSREKSDRMAPTGVRASNHEL